MARAPYPRLLGDIGGTHARLAWVDAPAQAPSHVATYKCAEHDSLYAAVVRYQTEHARPRPLACAIGIANPIVGDDVRMTNHHWSFSISALQRQLGVQQLKVINDFTALAFSLPALAAGDLRALGGGTADVRAPRALIGPGTGLGVSALLPGSAAELALSGEGGHVTLSPCDEQEAEIVAILRRRFGHASAERALSGPGLVNLYHAAAELAGQPSTNPQPEEVVRIARATPLSHCATAVDLFCRFLGTTAGNLALTLGARGGVYIGGGIAPKLLPELATSRFRERFEAKGRFREYLASIPCWVIDAPVSPALLGASRALDC
jgi:glucokinase